MTDLTTFLLARIAEDEDRSREEWVGSLPDVPLEEAVAAWDRLAMTSALRFNIAVRELGVAIVAGVGWASRLRQLAASHSDHPDYRQEWAPTPQVL